MLSPTSMSAMSIERISNAVPASSPFSRTRLEIRVGILQDEVVRLGRADRRDDPLAHPGDDGFLGGTADEPVDVRTDRHPSLHLQLDAILGDPVDRLPALGRIGAVDHLRVHAGLDGVEDIAAGQIDSGGLACRGQGDIRSIGGDQPPRTTLGTLPPAR